MAKSHGLMPLCLALLIMSVASAYQFKVGGSKGWTVPGPNEKSYNQWAESNRFQIGDSLLFVYLPDRDSVLQVDADAYNTCNTSSYIQKFDDGNTVFTFNQSGPFYFISGVEANCLKNESLVVVVMGNRSSRGAAPVSSPPPPPSGSMESPPASPPTAEESASPPPPSSSSEVSPSSAPGGEESTSPPPPPNGASSLGLAGFMGTIGAFLGSLLVL